MSSQMTTNGSFNLSPQNLNEAMQLAQIMADSEMVPKDFQGKPGNVLVAVQMGADIGLAPMQAIQNIAVINGRPALWGDAIKAIVLASPLCEKFEETLDENTMTAYTKVKRKGHEEKLVSFSKADAISAKLWGKAGPWTQYPKRMLQMRSRGFAARDEFADVLKGLAVAEEQQDMPIEKDVTPAQSTAPAEEVSQSTAPAEEVSDDYYPHADFVKNLPLWRTLIEKKKKTASEVITTVELKGLLTPEKQSIIKSIKIGEDS
jgi:hypothetical protein